MRKWTKEFVQRELLAPKGFLHTRTGLKPRPFAEPWPLRYTIYYMGRKHRLGMLWGRFKPEVFRRFDRRAGQEGLMCLHWAVFDQNGIVDGREGVIEKQAWERYFPVIIPSLYTSGLDWGMLVKLHTKRIRGRTVWHTEPKFKLQDIQLIRQRVLDA